MSSFSNGQRPGATFILLANIWVCLFLEAPPKNLWWLKGTHRTRALGLGHLLLVVFASDAGAGSAAATPATCAGEASPVAHGAGDTFRAFCFHAHWAAKGQQLKFILVHKGQVSGKVTCQIGLPRSQAFAYHLVVRFSSVSSPCQCFWPPV